MLMLTEIFTQETLIEHLICVWLFEKYKDVLGMTSPWGAKWLR